MSSKTNTSNKMENNIRT